MYELALQNELLARLPRSLLERWLQRMCLVELPKGYQLRLGGQQRVIYFPLSCVIALNIRTARGPSVFLRFTGRDFVVGLVDLLKAGDISFDGVVEGAGYALTLSTKFFAGQLPALFLGAAPQATAMARIAESGIQSAYCANHHGASQRLAKVLLQAADCFGEGRSITLSQYKLGEILSARRETVAQLLADWNDSVIVESQRARQLILDRSRLERISCECYGIVKNFYQEELLIWKNIQWRDLPSSSPVV